MSNTVKKVRQTCTCKNCGNESEMVITCTLEDIHEHTEKAPSYEQAENKAEKQRVKGSATCTHCGNEADMWIDI
jgi:transcription elongation factor Elf1